MDKGSTKLYPSKDIVIGYITTINPSSYTVEGQIEKSVIALRKNKYEDTIYISIDERFPYYSVDKIIPITKKMKSQNIFISKSEIDRIIEQEKQIQNQLNLKPIQLDNINIESGSQKIAKMTNELSIDKVKRLMTKGIR